MSLKFRLVVLWNVFSAMPHVWPKLGVPDESYGYLLKLCWILSYYGERTCTQFHAPNIFYLILKLAQKLLWTLLFPMQSVSHNLDPLWRRYDFFTMNTSLRLVTRLVRNPIFQSVYLRNFNDPEAKICTIGTFLCLLNNLQFFISQVSHKKLYSENGKMDFFWKQNPRINVVIPNVMIQMLKI